MTGDTTVADDEDTAADAEEPLLKPSLTEFPWVYATVASLATLLVEYAVLVTALLISPSTVTRPEWPLAEKAIQYVYVLYSAHHVPIATTVQQGVQVGTRLNNLLYGQSLFPVVLFFLLPVVALSAAGYLFEEWHTPYPTVTRFEESAMVGVGFALPYVAVGALGSFVFVRRIASENAQAASAPALLWALVATFLFPMAFVTLGAAVAYEGTDQA